MCLKLFYCRKTPFFYWANQTFSAKTVDLLLIQTLCLCNPPSHGVVFRHTLRFHEFSLCHACTVRTARARSPRELRRLKLELGEVWVPIWAVKKSNPAKVLLSSSRRVKTEWRAVETASLGSLGEPLRVSGLEGILRLMWWRNQLLEALHSEKVGCADHREVVFLIQWLTWIRLKLSPDALPLIYTSGAELFDCFWAIPPC